MGRRMANSWKGRRVVVTGGAGFMGSRVVERLRSAGAEVSVPRSREYNLVDGTAVKRLFKDARPDIVIHAAAVVGGIGANRANAGSFFYDNLMMGVHLIEYARRFGVPKQERRPRRFSRRRVHGPRPQTKMPR